MKVNSLLLHFNILSWSKIKASVEIPNFLNTSHSYFCSFSKFHLSGQNQTSPPVINVSPCYISSCHTPFQTLLPSEAGLLRKWALRLDLCWPAGMRGLLPQATGLCWPGLVAQRGWGCGGGSLAGSLEVCFPWAWIWYLGEICQKEWLVTDTILPVPVKNDSQY